MSTLPPDYAQRVYAGWLGKCIGVRFGAPTESLWYRDIKALFGELTYYLQTDPRVFHPDDDLTVPLLMLRTLDDYGDDPPVARFGDTWLNYIADGRGTLWWGGYGISSEHTAYMNLRAGIAAPHSGSIATNGPVIAQQIGGQIFSDVWGLICPNDPARAAELAKRAAQVSHDGEAVYGGMFIAALDALAFSATHVREVITGALAHIPADSRYAQVVREVMAFYDAHPSDWHACYEWIFNHHGYHHYPGRVHVIPNAAVCVMSLLYGENDFVRTMQIGNMAGWDTDCNVGNMACVVAVMRGLDAIPTHWRTPLNDFFTLASLTGSRNMLDAAMAAHEIIRHGHRQAGLPEPASRARYTWQFVGSTQGWEPINSGIDMRLLAEIVTVAQSDDSGTPALRITAADIFNRRQMGAYTRTYLRPADLDGNNYQGTFSPSIYPGQTITCRVMAHPKAQPDLIANLFVKDGNADASAPNPHSADGLIQSPGLKLVPGEWQTLTWRIPPMTGACLSQVGILITAKHAPKANEAVYVADFDWSGTPDFAYDFRRERIETDGSSQWTYLRGYWSLEGDAYVGSGVGQNESYSGDIGWRDYTLSAQVTPIGGDPHGVDGHMVLARVQGSLRSYALALLPGKLALLKNNHGYTELVSVPFEWAHGQTHTLALQVHGAELIGTCGDVTLRFTDPTPYLSGMIGLANQRGCRTAFRAVRVG